MVFTVEMHHKRQEQASPGDNIGMNVKGLDKMNMPRTGMSWCTRRTQRWALAITSTPKSKCWTSPARSRSAIRRSVSCAAARGVPHLEDRLEDRQGDWRQEDGGAALPEVERDGRGDLRAAAAAGCGHVQELRGPFPHRFLGRQRRRHAWKDREEGGQGGGRQEEVSRLSVFSMVFVLISPWMWA